MAHANGQHQNRQYVNSGQECTGSLLRIEPRLYCIMLRLLPRDRKLHKLRFSIALELIAKFAWIQH